MGVSLDLRATSQQKPKGTEFREFAALRDSVDIREVANIRDSIIVRDPVIIRDPPDAALRMSFPLRVRETAETGYYECSRMRSPSRIRQYARPGTLDPTELLPKEKEVIPLYCPESLST